VIRTLAADEAPKRMLIALNDRIADGRDVSWIWDVDFERLAPQIGSAICCGTRAAEMAMRLKYAGVALDRIEVRTDMDEALDRLAAAGGSSYLLATYTAMLDLRGRLERRGAWRGIEFEAIAIGPGDALPDADLYYLGGGQDRDQLLIADDIARHAEPLRAALDGGAGVLAVCGGYQLLGHYYRGHQGDEMRGIGLVDLVTEAGSRRMIGNIMLDCRLDGAAPRRLVGFENHA